MSLILASNSASRRAMLAGAGVEFEPIPAGLDERALEQELAHAGANPAAVALALAEAKARAVSRQWPGRLVLGGDSLVEVGGQRFDKPLSREQAAAHLAFFSGQTMQMHSSAALVRDEDLLWHHGQSARLRVRRLSGQFITDYLDCEWPGVADCVGVFRIEGLGVQLFEAIEGDHFTVLGMPLLAVLGGLRALGELAQ